MRAWRHTTARTKDARLWPQVLELCGSYSLEVFWRSRGLSLELEGINRIDNPEMQKNIEFLAQDVFTVLG